MKRTISERNLVIILFFATLAIFAIANYDTKIKSLRYEQANSLNAGIPSLLVNKE